MSAPLVVNTKDGVCWTRRTVTSSGIALYAPADVCRCLEFVMATLAELAEHGIRGQADVLPVPVGPEPQASRPIAYAARNTDLLLADAAERSRAAEWPWDMWCRICHIRPTSHRTEAEALEAADRHVKLEHAPQAEVHKLMAAGGLSELERLRARVAELEALEPAAIQTCRACGAGYTYGEPCSVCAFKARMAAEVDGITRRIAPTQALGEDEPVKVPCSKCGGPVYWAKSTNSGGGFWRHTIVPGRELDHFGMVAGAEGRHAFEKEYQGVSDAKRRLARCRHCGQDRAAPMHAEAEGEHYASVHHNYRQGRDLPGTDGAS